ncbi:uncharacterized protein LOC124143480 [Haliotis rufescens]|uniref:uncharacterized protein LOC124143480 n=1 Tax=Haliotis rufescens TaxID=6454 RepID=UPI001EB02A13|nr:uncharacterized protein LOC124143480 [Haliotis rufescens]
MPLLCLYIAVASLGLATAPPPPNIALNRPTGSSSAFPFSGVTYGPSRAVDGNIDPNFLNGSCFSSDVNDIEPFWYVDLEAFYVIDSITLFNRGDCCEERIRNITIEVFDRFPFTETPEVCGLVSGGVPAAGTIAIICPDYVVGRYIRISKMALDNFDTLQFCEVQVQGSALACPAGYEQLDRYCFYSSCFATTFAQAQEYCNVLFTDLAEIRTTDMNNFVTSILPAYPKDANYWIGATNMEDKETWRYLYGDAVYPTNFTYPLLNGTSHMTPFLGLSDSQVVGNDPRSDNCALLRCNDNGDYLWDRQSCNSKEYFLCCGVLSTDN